MSHNFSNSYPDEELDTAYSTTPYVAIRNLESSTPILCSTWTLQLSAFKIVFRRCPEIRNVIKEYFKLGSFELNVITQLGHIYLSNQ
jgi:hypothetical protein